MNRYLKYSILIHVLGLIILGMMTWFTPRPVARKLELVILPKGTDLEAKLTREVVEAMKKESHPNNAAATELPPAKPLPGNSTTPAPTLPPPIEPTSAPTPQPTPRPAATPKLSPLPATPSPTPRVTPKLTPTTTPKPTPRLTPKPTPKPTPTPTPKPKKTAAPTPKPTSKPDKSEPNVVEDSSRNKSKITPKPSPSPRKPTPKPSPTPLESAYDIPDTVPDDQARELANLPKKLPSNADVVGKLAPGEKAGVPGVAEGVEGAPLPLDKNQSMLSMLYTNRVKLLISRHFTVPPGVDNPDLKCIVEWEILPDGKVQNVRVRESSGVAQLDACAVDALNKAENVGPLPPEFGQRSVWTSLTFYFSAGGGA